MEIGWFRVGALWEGLNIGVVMIGMMGGVVNGWNRLGGVKERDEI